jgi:hypothetical protein
LCENEISSQSREPFLGLHTASDAKNSWRLTSIGKTGGGFWKSGDGLCVGITGGACELLEKIEVVFLDWGRP